MIDHYHCWEQKQPPACGIKTEHKRCCLCEATRSKDWREEFRIIENKYYISGQPENYLKKQQVEDIVSFIENTRKNAVREALEEVETSIIGAFGLRFLDEMSEKTVLDIIRKYIESI